MTFVNIDWLKANGFSQKDLDTLAGQADVYQLNGKIIRK